jgi:hypothetical protein
VVKPVSSDQKEFLQSIYNKYFKKDESQLNNHENQGYSSPESPSPKKSPIRIKTSFDSGSRLSQGLSQFKHDLYKKKTTLFEPVLTST